MCLKTNWSVKTPWYRPIVWELLFSGYGLLAGFETLSSNMRLATGSACSKDLFGFMQSLSRVR